MESIEDVWNWNFLTVYPISGKKIKNYISYNIHFGYGVLQDHIIRLMINRSNSNDVN